MSQNKTCNKCGEAKPLGAFHRERQGKYGRRGSCIECEKPMRQSWYLHPDVVARNRDKQRKYREGNRESFNAKHSSYMKGYRHEHGDKLNASERRYRSENPEVVLACARRYSRSEKGLARGHRRRERQRALDTMVSGRFLAFVKSFWSEKCAVCGRGNNLTIDHWLPLSLGYGLSASNAVLLCGSCNSSKKNRLPHLWAENDVVLHIEALMLEQEEAWIKYVA